jgi:hypothetical protein
LERCLTRTFAAGWFCPNGENGLRLADELLCSCQLLEAGGFWGQYWKHSCDVWHSCFLLTCLDVVYMYNRITYRLKTLLDQPKKKPNEVKRSPDRQSVETSSTSVSLSSSQQVAGHAGERAIPIVRELAIATQLPRRKWRWRLFAGSPCRVAENYRTLHVIWRPAAAGSQPWLAPCEASRKPVSIS